MISVILKDGRVIQYNQASNVTLLGGCFTVVDKDDYWYGKFPKEVVERIDGVKPCKILSERRDKKRMRKYKP